MSELLQPGQVVQSRRSGLPCKIGKFLGGGGQGEVYQAEWGGKPVAVKWYFEASATPEQRQAIEALVAEGPPTDQFLWPLDLLTAPGAPGFGYVMPLRPSNFKGLTDLMAGKIDPSFHTLLTACLGLAQAFRQLHVKGLCYRDISFGNAFFDPKTGEVLICDNDNVGEKNLAAGILGTPDFMAPEVVRGDANPSTATDLHSLAVLLFYMLFIGHPLQGGEILKIRAWDRPAREKLFGKQPVFIFDPQNASNAAVPLSRDTSGEAGGTALQYWSIYPPALRDTFTKSFTTGLHNPDARITEGTWQDVFVQARDSIIRCRKCGTPNFFDARRLQQSGTAGECWQSRCRAALDAPLRLRIGRNQTVLAADTRLYEHHLDDSFRFSKPVAEVVRHPTDPNVWGLKNLTAAKWVGSFGDGSLKDIDPGRSIPLSKGTRVNFGKTEGEFIG